MPRGAIMAPLREGVSKWRPFISKVSQPVWGHLGYTFHLCYLRPRKQCFWVLFLAPQKWRVSNVSFACRVDVQGVPKRHPFRLRGVVLAPLNACRQCVTTRESRVICVSDFPKIIFCCSARLQPCLPKMVQWTSLSPYPVVFFWFG